ncbi:siphovirus Gp157 family protein, partial [Methylobacterium sp. SD274]|uniref:siphovirus Gp157 family protein n=1 Tax=Methylobacterium sp. SD274 TaxID=2782009 RepID=UPI001A975DBD
MPTDTEALPNPRKVRRDTSIAFDAAREIEAAKVLREQIAALAGGDDEFVRDTLEGEVDFEGLCGRLVASIGEDEALAAGLKTYRDTLGQRIAAMERRADEKRTLLLSTLEIAGRPSLTTTTGTVSTRPVPPKLVIVEESEIPSNYWTPQPPKLDSAAVRNALKDSKTVPGATLSNGGKTISIRRA